MDVIEKSTFFVKLCPIRPQNVYDTFSDTLKVRGKVDLVKGPSKSRSRQRSEKRSISSKVREKTDLVKEFCIHAPYRKSNLCIPSNETARPRSQFLFHIFVSD
jgi:hypothetical protein